MNRIIAAIACVAILTSAAIAGVPHQQWYKKADDENPRWYVAPEEGPLTGSQNGWYTSPHDLLPGSFGLVGKIVSDVTDTSFEFDHTNNVWGDWIYRVTRVQGKADMAEMSERLRTKPFISTDRARWADLAKAGDGKVSLKGVCKRIVKPGKEFIIDLTFADVTVPVKLEVIRANHKAPKPDFRSVRYGPHWKHAFDVYLPDDKQGKPWPTIVNIHGGGWGAKDKASQAGGSTSWNERGFAYVAISYRYTSMADNYPAMEPPVAAPLLDAARAIQMLRYRAGEFGIDPNRLGFTGGSAGAATSCWLALHDDLADPDSPDPVSRMSTKPQAVVAVQAQTSLDPRQMRRWIPPVTYGVHAFFPSSAGKAPKDREEAFEFWLSKRDEIMPWIREFSPAQHVDANDPPILLNYLTRTMDLPGNPTHHARFGKGLHDLMQEAGAESYFVWGDQDRNEKYGTWAGTTRFFLDKLGSK